MMLFGVLAVQVVSLHCNLDSNTFHLLNEDRLNMMKKDAVLVNCARGPVIDEVALTNFLQANENFRSAGAHSWPARNAVQTFLVCCKPHAACALASILLIYSIRALCLSAIHPAQEWCSLSSFAQK